MHPLLRSLLLISLLAWLPADGARERAPDPARPGWSAAATIAALAATPATPARPAARSGVTRAFLPAAILRTGQRHAPPGHGPVQPTDAARRGSPRPPARRAPRGWPSRDPGARALAFPYDATAPPPRA